MPDKPKLRKAGRPANTYKTTRLVVPVNLVPEIKKLIEEWKLNKEQDNGN